MIDVPIRKGRIDDDAVEGSKSEALQEVPVQDVLADTPRRVLSLRSTPPPASVPSCTPRVKEAGLKFAPKQDLFVGGRGRSWTWWWASLLNGLAVSCERQASALAHASEGGKGKGRVPLSAQAERGR